MVGVRGGWATFRGFRPGQGSWRYSQAVFSLFLSPAFFFARSQQVLLLQLLKGYILHPFGAPARVRRRFFWGASWILAHTPARGMVGFRGDCRTRGGAPLKYALAPPDSGAGWRAGGWAGWLNKRLSLRTNTIGI